MNPRDPRTLRRHRPRSAGLPTILALVLAGFVAVSACAQPPAGGGGGFTQPTGVTKTILHSAYWLEGPGRVRVQSRADADFESHCVDCGGFRIVDVETAFHDGPDGGDRRFAALWHEAPSYVLGLPEMYRTSVDVPLAALAGDLDAQRDDGFELVDVEVYILGGEQLYAAVWHPRAPPHELELGTSLGQPVPGWPLVDVETWEVDGTRYWASLRRQDPDLDVATLLPGLPWQDFYDTAHLLFLEGYRLLDLEIYHEGDSETELYGGLFFATGERDDYLLVGAAWNTVELKAQNPFQEEAGDPDGAIVSPTSPMRMTELELAVDVREGDGAIEGQPLHSDGMHIPPP